MKWCDLSSLLKRNNIENNLNIKQPWILWRFETSKLSIEEVAKLITENTKEEGLPNENSNDNK